MEAERLRAIARGWGEKALQTKQIVELQPMRPHDRRIVHMAIARSQDCRAAAGRRRKSATSSWCEAGPRGGLDVNHPRSVPDLFLWISQKSPEGACFDALGLWSVAKVRWCRCAPIPGAPLSISPGHALC
jgi:hypothetical protein